MEITEEEAMQWRTLLQDCMQQVKSHSSHDSSLLKALGRHLSLSEVRPKPVLPYVMRESMFGLVCRDPSLPTAPPTRVASTEHHDLELESSEEEGSPEEDGSSGATGPAPPPRLLITLSQNGMGSAESSDKSMDRENDVQEELPSGGVEEEEEEEEEDDDDDEDEDDVYDEEEDLSHDGNDVGETHLMMLGLGRAHGSRMAQFGEKTSLGSDIVVRPNSRFLDVLWNVHTSSLPRTGPSPLSTTRLQGGAASILDKAKSAAPTDPFALFGPAPPLPSVVEPLYQTFLKPAGRELRTQFPLQKTFGTAPPPPILEAGDGVAQLGTQAMKGKEVRKGTEGGGTFTNGAKSTEGFGAAQWRHSMKRMRSSTNEDGGGGRPRPAAGTRVSPTTSPGMMRQKHNTKTHERCGSVSGLVMSQVRESWNSTFNLPDEFNGIRDLPLAEQEELIRENLVQTEKMYLNKLNLVVKHFLLPLVEEASKMSYLKRTDFTPLYLVLQEIVRCNMMILLDIGTRNSPRAKISERKEGLTHLFLGLVYCSFFLKRRDFDTSITHYMTYVEFERFMEQCCTSYLEEVGLSPNPGKREKGTTVLFKALAAPEERITYYTNIFRLIHQLKRDESTLSPRTSETREKQMAMLESSRGFASMLRDTESAVKEVLDIFRSISVTMNGLKETDMDRLRQIQDSVQGNYLSIVEPHRRFLRSSVLLCDWGSQLPYKVFLCSDLILYTTLECSHSRHKYAGVFLLRDCLQVAETCAEGQQEFQFGFSLTYRGKVSICKYTFFAANNQERQKWIQDIDAQLDIIRLISERQGVAVEWEPILMKRRITGWLTILKKSSMPKMGKLHAIQKSSSRPLVWAEVSGNHLRWFSTKSKETCKGNMAQPKGQIALTEYELILLPSCAAMFALQHRNKSACIYIVKCDNVENLKIWISVLQAYGVLLDRLSLSAIEEEMHETEFEELRRIGSKIFARQKAVKPRPMQIPDTDDMNLTEP